MKKGLLGVLNVSTMFLAVLLPSSSAFAVSVNGSVGATSVPSLSGSMLVVLSLLLFAIAFRIGKQNKAVNKLFITLLGIGMLVSAGSGVILITDAKAGGAPVDVINLSGGTFGGAPNVLGGYLALLNNNSGQAVTITFTPDAGPNPSHCFLKKVPVISKPVKSSSSQARLAAAPLGQPCGNAGGINFASGGTYTVTLAPNEACSINCSAPD